MITPYMKTSEISRTLYRLGKYPILTLMFLCCIAIGELEAVEPDTTLYSNQAEIRAEAYAKKATQLTEMIALAPNDKEKQNLMVQQQLLAKLKELPEKPEKPSMDLRFSEQAVKKTLSWQDVEQYLERYVAVIDEEKISVRNLENTNKHMQTLQKRLIALADDSAEQNILQLQHAYQVRKFSHQSEIDKQLRAGLEIAKEQYPDMLERIHIDQGMVEEQRQELAGASKGFENLENEIILAVASSDALIQQQESLLAGYLGHELGDDEKRIMNYEQLQLLNLRVQQLFNKSQLFTSKLSLLKAEQKAVWFSLLSTQPDFFELADIGGDIDKKIVQLKKDTNGLLVRIYTFEKELSSLRGGNALIGPKAQELIATLDDQIREAFTLLSGIDQRSEMLSNKGKLLDRAIDLKQSALGSMVTKTREATDNVFEKVISVLKYPLFSYSGMTITLLLFLQVLVLLILGIIINRLYSHIVMRMGRKRRWSERTIQLVHAVGKYPFIFIVAMVILSVIGISTSSLALIAGALSVGIGFGMQTIVNNLVSGVILLFDKSIRPGDFISLGENCLTGGFRGNVVQMNTRATVLRTNDNINIIIPNADLMASQVVNWTYSDEKIRFRVPFSVAYGSDIEKVKKLVKAAISELPVVLSQPEPQIWMSEHAESALALIAAIWVEGQNARQPARTFDTVLTKIYITLQENGIEIPFPQMDLHLRDAEHQGADITNITEAIRHRIAAREMAR